MKTSFNRVVTNVAPSLAPRKYCEPFMSISPIKMRKGLCHAAPTFHINTRRDLLLKHWMCCSGCKICIILFNVWEIVEFNVRNAMSVWIFQRETWVYSGWFVSRRRDSGVVQRLPQGLPQWTSVRRRIQENIWQFLSLRWREQVRGTCVSHLRR